ncbi:unnamed protein product [Caenorhabditis bovis]|uniref:DNA/RNA-binding domain-containing protein n=1 Tax=Caenorhabditis bovis TaxID=2654633 RepID=A0A8S1EWY2_9PELO|nr:unnamed protein product [Caenorhabditis bovis]
MKEENSSNEWEILFEECNKLPKGPENSPENLKHIMRLFVADFTRSMESRLHSKFWQIMKNMIDSMTNSSPDKIVRDNVLNLSIGYLTDLSLLVHSFYKMPNLNLPPFLTFKSRNSKEFKSTTLFRVFGAFIALRMGDLMRYKGENERAREYYELSVCINQADGTAWNQLGVINSKCGKLLESLYCHSRALYAYQPFQTASANLSAIFRKFANKDTSKEMPLRDLFIAIISKIHFMLNIEGGDEVFERLGPAIGESKEMICSLVAASDNLDAELDRESSIFKNIEKLWKISHKELLQHMNIQKPSDEQLHLLMLLLRRPEYCTTANSSELVSYLKSRGDSVIPDPERFHIFM